MPRQIATTEVTAFELAAKIAPKKGPGNAFPLWLHLLSIKSIAGPGSRCSYSGYAQHSNSKSCNIHNVHQPRSCPQRLRSDREILPQILINTLPDFAFMVFLQTTVRRKRFETFRIDDLFKVPGQATYWDPPSFMSLTHSDHGCRRCGGTVPMLDLGLQLEARLEHGKRQTCEDRFLRWRQGLSWSWR